MEPIRQLDKDIIKQLEDKGLKLTEEDFYYWVEDSEGHVIRIDSHLGVVTIMDDEGDEDCYYEHEKDMIMDSVLSALDY